MFRTGTTSYIIPADILPNVEYLAPQVDDVQLVLFETDEHGSNLPGAEVCRRLAEIAARQHLTYTVHLPLDLHFGTGPEPSHVSLVKARRVIEATRSLRPFAYTLHLDGSAFQEAPPDAAAWQRWQADAEAALRALMAWVDDPARLCIENLERWDPDLFAPLVEALPVGRTVDIGHLWLQGRDPVAHLQRWLPRTRVVHLHGIAARDHASLRHVEPKHLDAVMRCLVDGWDGVLTLEVFSQEDLQTSLDCLRQSLARIGRPCPCTS